MSALSTAKPHWDAKRRCLLLGTRVVKHFQQPAPTQEMILATFEEEGWPKWIDDPLPPLRGANPKQRLHQTLRNLNRGQTSPGITFHGNGLGTGIGWTVAVA